MASSTSNKSDETESPSAAVTSESEKPPAVAGEGGALVPKSEKPEGGTALVPHELDGLQLKRRLSWQAKLLILLLLAGVAGGGGYFIWQRETASAVPPGFAMTNGRLEAERIDVATKLGGRVDQVKVKEGDSVKRGQVIAVMEMSTYKAQLAEDEAGKRQAQQQLGQAKALVTQRQAELKLAEQELGRSTTLLAKGFATQDLVDQRQSARNTAAAALTSAQAQVSLAQAAIDSAEARAEAERINIADSTIAAPLDGRIQYRLALPGEVLAAGGRIVSMLDLSDVYMTVFLPTRDAGKLALGGEARLIFDAAPNYVVPAFVSYVASDAQFTPKYVETKSERDKLMYRVKLQIPVPILKKYSGLVKSGITGIAYVRTDPKAAWPDNLKVSLP